MHGSAGLAWRVGCSLQSLVVLVGAVTLGQVAAAVGPVIFRDADPDRIGQVLGNLLDNALRHTARGGTVMIALVSMPDAVRLTVTDTGDGIAAEHLPHVFERFYRVDPARDRDHGAQESVWRSCRPSSRLTAIGSRPRVTAPARGPGSW